MRPRRGVHVGDGGLAGRSARRRVGGRSLLAGVHLEQLAQRVQLADVPLVQPDHPVAAPGADDQTLAGQGAQRVAHRAPAHPEPGRQ
jgi:hypothetical protein